MTPIQLDDAKIADCVVSIERLSQKTIDLLTQGRQNEQNDTLPVPQNQEQSKSKPQQVEPQQLVEAEKQQLELNKPIKPKSQPMQQRESKCASFHDIFGDFSEDDSGDDQIPSPKSKNAILSEDSLQSQLEVNNDDRMSVAFRSATSSQETNGYSTNCSPTEMDKTDHILKSPGRHGFTSASEDESFVSVKDQM